MKRKGFTLLEIIITLAIGAILLGIVSGVMLKNTFTAGNNFRSTIDVQEGVKTSMDMIANTLKKVNEVHLVGKNIFPEGKSLEQLANGLDKNYSYIALQKDSEGNSMLYNFISDGKTIEPIPIMSSDSKDILSDKRVVYDMQVYPGEENNTTTSRENKIFTIKIIGKVERKGPDGKYHFNENQKSDKFELERNFSLNNVHQILFSKTIEKEKSDYITAIAYSDKKPPQNTNVSVIFAINDSTTMSRLTISGKKKPGEYNGKIAIGEDKPINGQMQFVADGLVQKYDELKYKTILVGNPTEVYNNLEDFLKKYSTRKYILVNTMDKYFFETLHQKAIESKSKLDVYMYTFDEYPKYFELEDGGNYFYDLNKIEAKGYGPYNFGDEESYKKALNYYNKDQDGLKMTYSITDVFHPKTKNSNLGEAVRQGFEIGEQIKNRDRNQRVFFILLTDSRPSSFTVKFKSADSGTYDLLTDKSILSRNKGSIGTNNDDRKDSMNFMNKILDQYMDKDPFYKSYIIGMSDPKDIQAEVTYDDLVKGFQNAVKTDRFHKALEERKKEDQDKPGIKHAEKGATDLVQFFRGNDKKNLEYALEDIVNSISSSMQVFDGPQDFSN